jgi:hypothetical protein
MENENEKKEKGEKRRRKTKKPPEAGNKETAIKLDWDWPSSNTPGGDLFNKE